MVNRTLRSPIGFARTAQPNHPQPKCTRVRKLFALALAVGLSLPLGPLQAAALSDADEIIRQANLRSFYAGEDGRAEARMLIVDGQGRQQLRQFHLLRKDQQDGGNQDFMVFFSRPSDVRGTVFRVAKQPGAEDDRWLYLPGLDLVKRIAPGDKRTSFVGSHFFYEDVSGRNIREDRYQLIGEEADRYLIEGQPKQPDSVEFQRYRVWIDQQTLLPMKVEYYDDQDKLYRRVEAEKVETIEGHPTVVQARVSDLRGGGHTTLQFRNIDYDLGLPDSLFSERSLRNPPSEWLRP